jgi:hypothetical protein
MVHVQACPKRHHHLFSHLGFRQRSAFSRVRVVDRCIICSGLGDPRERASRRRPLRQDYTGPEYTGDAVVNSAGDMLATIAGFLATARWPHWVPVVLFFAGLLFPHDSVMFLR